MDYDKIDTVCTDPDLWGPFENIIDETEKGFWDLINTFTVSLEAEKKRMMR